MLLTPLPAFAQGGGGGGSGGGWPAVLQRAVRPPDPQPVAAVLLVRPMPGSAGAGTAGVSGVPSGPANAGGLKNSGNAPSGAGNSAKVHEAPGTNAKLLGLNRRHRRPRFDHRGDCRQQSLRCTTTTGRIDGTTTPGPSMPGDAEIRAEDPKVDQKIKNICKGG